MKRSARSNSSSAARAERAIARRASLEHDARLPARRGSAEQKCGPTERVRFDVGAWIRSVGSETPPHPDGEPPAARALHRPPARSRARRPQRASDISRGRRLDRTVRSPIVTLIRSLAQAHPPRVSAATTAGGTPPRGFIAAHDELETPAPSLRRPPRLRAGARDISLVTARVAAVKRSRHSLELSPSLPATSRAREAAEAAIIELRRPTIFNAPLLNRKTSSSLTAWNRRASSRTAHNLFARTQPRRARARLIGASLLDPRRIAA